MQAISLLNQGKLDEAIDSAIEHVRSHPADSAGRAILAELFCFRGDYERADKQCEAVIVQQPQDALPTSLLRQLIRAETSRREVWSQGRLPEFIGGPTEACRQTVAALVELTSGSASEGLAMLEQLEHERSPSPGVCNGKAFDDIRDLDDFCAGFWEVLTSTGKYFWIPTNRIESIDFSPVTRPRDLIWRQCEMSVDDGPTGVVYVPTLYCDTDLKQDSPERLGRATRWTEEEGMPVRGVGQRTYLVGEDELGIMELESLTLDH